MDKRFNMFTLKILVWQFKTRYQKKDIIGSSTSGPGLLNRVDVEKPMENGDFRAWMYRAVKQADIVTNPVLSVRQLGRQGTDG